MEIAARFIALAHRDLPFLQYSREFCGLATVTALNDATILSLFWHGANSHRPVDLPDTKGLCWREGILRCLESFQPRARTSLPSSAAPPSPPTWPAALPCRPAENMASPRIINPRQSSPVPAPRLCPPVPLLVLPSSPEPLLVPSSSPEPLLVPPSSPEPLLVPTSSPEPAHPRARSSPAHPRARSSPAPSGVRACRAPSSARACRAPSSARACRAPPRVRASRAHPRVHASSAPPSARWSPYLPQGNFGGG